MKDKILIIGGYGTVGSTIATHLSKVYPNKIIVAGRNIEKWFLIFMLQYVTLIVIINM